MSIHRKTVIAYIASYTLSYACSFLIGRAISKRFLQ